ncbi:hypothetical protein KTE91_33170 [Burkholderia multivorans]|nr:hypothetical protein [Burkholderia multivorans]MBU9439928.1 hypothetical protein [Burkholderia multivorans]
MFTFAITFRVAIGQDEFDVLLLDAPNEVIAEEQADKIFGARFVEIERVV